MSNTHFILVQLSVVFLLSGCGSSSRYALPEACLPSMQARLIGDEALPSQWLQDTGPPASNDEFSTGATAHCMVSFHISESVGHEQVFRYDTEEEARDDYVRLAELFSLENSTPYTLQEAIWADEYRVECARSTNPPTCNLTARYRAYIVAFNIHMSSDYMTDEDLRQAILAIDEKMIQE